jgi:hypothetical protein
VGLSGSFLIIFAGYATEGILLSLFSLFFVPFQLLIMYILWRFYWYLMLLSVLLAPLLSCASLTGLIRIAGVTYANLGGRSPVSAMGTNFALAVLAAIALATIVVLIIAIILKSVIGNPLPAPHYDDDEPQRQRSRKRGPRDLWKDERPYPPPNDPYWDDK